MITLYGIANSRAFRNLWMLEELGCEYQHVSTDYVGGSRQPEYLKLNPNGRVPCLVDGELTLFESLAINLYLARRYDSPLWPKTIADEARTFQWTFWATNELDAALGTLNRQGRLPEAERDTRAVEAAVTSLQAPMRVLDAQLSNSPYLLGTDFSLADLNVASVTSAAISARYDLSPFAHISAWLTRCFQRPAGKRCVALVLGKG